MKVINNIFFYIIVFLLVGYILIVSISPERMMNVIGYRAFIVLSDSMEPKIKVNDLIFLKEAKENNLDIGDIITFKVYIQEYEEEEYVTHYIGDIITINSKTVYKTRSINLDEDQFDQWLDKDGELIEITFDDIEGEYWIRIPYIGYIQKLFKDNYGLVFILVLGSVGYHFLKPTKLKETDL